METSKSTHVMLQTKFPNMSVFFAENRYNYHIKIIDMEPTSSASFKIPENVNLHILQKHLKPEVSYFKR